MQNLFQAFHVMTSPNNAHIKQCFMLQHSHSQYCTAHKMLSIASTETMLKMLLINNQHRFYCCNFFRFNFMFLATCGSGRLSWPVASCQLFNACKYAISYCVL